MRAFFFPNVVQTHGHVALDGTKIKANASKRVAMSDGRSVALAHRHDSNGATDEARRSPQRAIGLTTSPRVRCFLERESLMKKWKPEPPQER